MSRKMSKRERALRARWWKWECYGHKAIHRHGATACLRNGRGIMIVVIDGALCTRRSDAWRSLERAMERTAKSLRVLTLSEVIRVLQAEGVIVATTVQPTQAALGDECCCDCGRWLGHCVCESNHILKALLALEKKP